MWLVLAGCSHDPELAPAAPGSDEVVWELSGLEATSGRWLADLDGDGGSEVALLGWSASGLPAWYVYSGAQEGVLGAEDAWLHVYGWAPSGDGGPAIAAADVDGDGTRDLLILRADGVGWVRGPVEGLIDVAQAERLVAFPHVARSGPSPYRAPVEGIWFADYDGDGAEELLIERLVPVQGGEGLLGARSEVWGFQGPFDEVQSPRDAVFRVSSEATAEVVYDGPLYFCGSPLDPSPMGDLEGDGVLDWLFGRESCSPSTASGDAVGHIVLAPSGLGSGRVSPLGDVDGDGLAEVWVRTAVGDERASAVHTWPLPRRGDEIPESARLVVTGGDGAPVEDLARSTADLDGDGTRELLLASGGELCLASGKARGLLSFDELPCLVRYERIRLDTFDIADADGDGEADDVLVGWDPMPGRMGRALQWMLFRP